MTSAVEVKLPRSIVRRLYSEAEKKGMSLEEYLLELVLQNLDPSERAREYIMAADELLKQAREELDKGDIRQAAEKAWGAAALSIKAYAEWRDHKKLTSHGELWKYKDLIAERLGGWVRDAWMYANSMHTCFYEGWCSKKDVSTAIKFIEKLVNNVKKEIAK